MTVIFVQEVTSHQLILLRRQVFVGQLFTQQASVMIMSSQNIKTVLCNLETGTVKELRINRMILLGTTTFTCWNRSLDLYMESCVHSRCDIPREQLTNHQMIVMFVQGVISYQLILLHGEVFVGQLFT